MSDDEFDLIHKYFKPLANSSDAFNLLDDVGQLQMSGSKPHIITKDSMVEGVHFFSTDPLESVGSKLVAVNLTDIMSKGAIPLQALLMLAWPKDRSLADVKNFAEGLGKVLAAHNIALIGGDTVSTHGPLICALTLTGQCLEKQPILRKNAKCGDDIWLSGYIGDSVLGLLSFLGKSDPRYGLFDWSHVNATQLEGLQATYRTPNIPDISIAALIAEFANAAIDISDGLIADIGHIAHTSGLGAELIANAIPLSSGVHSILDSISKAQQIAVLATGGDDYQIAFTASKQNRDNIIRRAEKKNLGLVRIGRMVKGDTVTLLMPNDKILNLDCSGWNHFPLSHK